MYKQTIKEIEDIISFDLGRKNQELIDYYDLDPQPSAKKALPPDDGGWTQEEKDDIFVLY